MLVSEAGARISTHDDVVVHLALSCLWRSMLSKETTPHPTPCPMWIWEAWCRPLLSNFGWRKQRETQAWTAITYAQAALQRPWVKYTELTQVSTCLRPLGLLCIFHASRPAERRGAQRGTACPALRRGHAQLFWHQGLVSCRTVFPQTVGGRGWDGLGMIQANYSYCALYYYYISFTSGHQPLDPGGWGPPENDGCTS